MEVVGLLASLTALVGAARAVGAIAGTLYEIANGLNSAADEVRFLGCQIETFTSTSTMASVVIKSYCRMYRNSDVVAEMNRKAVLGPLKEQTKLIRQRIELLRPKLAKLIRRNVVVAELKWRWYCKKDTSSLQLMMDGVNSSLNLIMNMLKLEEVTHSKIWSSEADLM